MTTKEQAVDIADALIQKIRGGMSIDHVLHELYRKGYLKALAEVREWAGIGAEYSNTDYFIRRSALLRFLEERGK